MWSKRDDSDDDLNYEGVNDMNVYECDDCDESDSDVDDGSDEVSSCEKQRRRRKGQPVKRGTLRNDVGSKTPEEKTGEIPEEQY